MKLTNLELNVNLSNPVIFFDLDGTTYALLIDGSEKVLSGDMDGVNDDLTSQLEVDQNYDTETTTYSFDDFTIEYCNSEVTGTIK
tara:strand:+ start:390 stop:644 length:255 start_codon:yes stop_codon:yes gene_type:complete